MARNNIIKNKFQSVNLYNRIATFSCIIGIAVSAYAYYVEVSAEEDTGYKAMCDISEHMTCTKVFMSEYGKGFGIVGKILGEGSPLNVPNGFAGIFFYALVGLLSLTNVGWLSKIQLGLSLLSVLTSFYLAYILSFILYDFCIVCVTTYVLNFINLFCSYQKVNLFNKNNVHLKRS